MRARGFPRQREDCAVHGENMVVRTPKMGLGGQGLSFETQPPKTPLFVQNQ